MLLYSAIGNLSALDRCRFLHHVHEFGARRFLVRAPREVTPTRSSVLLRSQLVIVAHKENRHGKAF
jgi:hypothetical protein